MGKDNSLEIDCVVTVGYPEKVDITPKWPSLKGLGTSLWGYVSGQPNHLNVSSKKLFMDIDRKSVV